MIQYGFTTEWNFSALNKNRHKMYGSGYNIHAHVEIKMKTERSTSTSYSCDPLDKIGGDQSAFSKIKKCCLRR